MENSKTSKSDNVKENEFKASKFHKILDSLIEGVEKHRLQLRQFRESLIER